MLYQLLASGLLIASMYLFLAFSIFLKAGTSVILLAILAVAVASGIFRYYWLKFERKNPYPPDVNKFTRFAFKLFGYFSVLALVIFAASLLFTGDLNLSLKFAGFLQCLFLLECTLLIAQA